MRTNTDGLSRSAVVFWILSLSFLAVGARNFELGLTVDAPFYATVARNIARSGELFLLQGSVPEYHPFFHHPPLGLWLLAFIFKFLPAADWSARIPGIVFYVLFLLVYFFHVRARNGEKVATWAVLLLWSWYRFSNYFSNVYLDPGALFFGFLAVVLADRSFRREKLLLSAASGLAFGIGVLYKGMALGGFLAPLALFPLLKVRRDKSLVFSAQAECVFLLGLSLALTPFLVALERSAIPNYLQLYWDFQMRHRLAREWTLMGWANVKFWKKLLTDTYYLLPLSLVAFGRPSRWRELLVPLSLFAAFCSLLVFSNLVGSQNWLYLMPWIAWLLADGVFQKVPIRCETLTRATTIFALFALFLVQFLPISVHGGQPSADELEVRRLSREGKINELFLDATPAHLDATTTSRFAWYGDVEVQNPMERDYAVPSSSENTAYLRMFRSPARHGQIQAKGWCLHGTYGAEVELWLKCPTSSSPQLSAKTG